MYLTFPFNSLPIKGLFLDLDTIISFVYVYLSYGSKIVISAILPSSIVPLSISFGGVFIKSKKQLNLGQFVECKITNVAEYDLIGEIE